MFQSRDETRQVYLTVWEKLQQGQILEPLESLIADIIQMHPEYHDLLSSGDAVQQTDFTPESGNSNPFLHMGMHIAIREQTQTDRPAGIKKLHKKLTRKKGVHDAEHLMMECLGHSLWLAQRNNVMPDEKTYLDCLNSI